MGKRDSLILLTAVFALGFLFGYLTKTAVAVAILVALCSLVVAIVIMWEE